MAVPKCKECEYRKPSVIRYGLYFCRHKEAKAQNIADYKTSPKWCPLRAKVIPPGGECDNCGEGFDTMGEAWTISEQVKTAT